MSKISVFKFNINRDEQTINIAKQIISNFLKSRRFFYNNEKLAYTTGKPTKQDYAKDMIGTIASAVSSAAIGSTFYHVRKSIQHGFEVKINGNQLIIKAYLIDCRYNLKQHIHSLLMSSNAATDYYYDLKNNLFKRLKENNIHLVSTEVEKVKDD